jgi:hypothetical protein
MEHEVEVVSAITDVDIEDMKKDTSEYVDMEGEIAKDFVQGLIKLGEILKRHKDKWKPRKQYTQYLSSINRSLSGANELIRIYEYSLLHMAELLQVNLTNWNKLHMFLGLPDPLKDKLAGKIDGEDVSTSEFREVVSDIKGEDGEIVVEEHEFPIENEGVEELISSSALVDVEYMAKQVVKELINNGVGSFTDNSVPIASGFLYVEKAMRKLENKNFKALTNEEKKFWNKIVRGQLDRLTNLIK